MAIKHLSGVDEFNNISVEEDGAFGRILTDTISPAGGSPEYPVQNLINSVVRVVHGATAGTARPSGATHVEWVGSVEPSNANTATDTWIDTA